MACLGLGARGVACGVLVAFAACDVSLASGVVRCDPLRSPACPEGYVCAPDPARPSEGTFCFDHVPDGGLFDAGALVDGSFPDTGRPIPSCWPPAPVGFGVALSTVGEVRLQAIARRDDETICVAGAYDAQTFIGEQRIDATGELDSIVACWRRDTFLGVATSAGTGSAEFFDVAIGANRVYAAGYVIGGKSFGTRTHGGAGDQDLLVVAYELDAAFEVGPHAMVQPAWATFAGDTQNQRATSIAVDPTSSRGAERVCVGGAVTGEILLSRAGGGETLILETADQDGFIACLAENGASALASPLHEIGADTIWDLTVGASGAFYLAGERANAAGESDPWVAILDPVLEPKEYTFEPCAGGTNRDAAYAIAVDEEDDPRDTRVFVTGTAFTEITYGDVIDCGPDGNTDFAQFVVSLRGADLQAMQSASFGTFIGNAAGLGIALDGDCVFTAGRFDATGATDFGLVSAGDEDAVIVGYDRDTLAPLAAVRYGDLQRDEAFDVAAGDSSGPIVVGVVEGEVPFGFAEGELRGTNGVVSLIRPP